MIAPGDVPLSDFTDPTTIRLIPAAYIDEPALKPLADDDAELKVLEEIEGLTSARRGYIGSLPEGVNPEELLTEHFGYGWSYVNAAFCYTRLAGNRFNGPERGAWYAAWGKDALATAQAEVAWHLTRELEATGVYENVTAYRELIAGFATSLHDLRGLEGEAFLDPEIASGHPAGQALARALFNGAESRGVLYPSLRKKGGNCLAAFRPHIIQNIRQGEGWVFTWDGSPEPALRRSDEKPPLG